MKKISKFLLVLLSLICLIGCSQNETILPNTDSPNLEDSSNNNSSDKDSNNSSDKDSNDDTTIPPSDLNKTEEKTIRIYYYNAVLDTSEYKDIKTNVTGGAITKAILTELKNLDDDIVKPTNTEITSAKVENSTLTINFKGSILPNSIGGGVEASYLSSFVNSFGYNLGVSNVIINIDGKPYSSGHIIQEKEGFSVNYSGFTKSSN